MSSFSISDDCENIVRMKFRAPNDMATNRIAKTTYEAQMVGLFQKLGEEHRHKMSFWVSVGVIGGFTAGIAVACLVARLAGVL